MVERNGGTVGEKDVTIACQAPVPVRLEKGFEGLYPVGRIPVNREVADVGEIVFDGTGIVFKGYVRAADEEYVARVEMHMDGELVETANLPAEFRTRRNDLFWKYQIPKGKHIFTFKWLNPVAGASVRFNEALVYSDSPLQVVHP